MASSRARRPSHESEEPAHAPAPQVAGPEHAAQSAPRPRRSADGPLGAQVAPLTVGAAHDPAERSADELADRVLRRLSPSLVAPAGDGAAVHRSGGSGALAGQFDADADVSERIRARAGRGSALPAQVRRSMEEGFGTGLGEVRIHTDGEAARLSDALGAEAFTHGSDVFFGAGRFDPEGGQHLLAHELAHVVQARSAPAPVVQRKLKGTHQAVTDMGGKASTRAKLKGSDYPKILSKLADYEAREAKVVAKGAFGKGDKEWMLKTIADLLALIQGWTARHEPYAVGSKERKARSRDLMNAMGDFQDALKAGDTAKVAEVEQDAQGSPEEQRVRTLNMVAPRLAAERQDLLSPHYFAIKSYSDATLAKGGDWNQDDAVGGAANRLDKVQHGADKGFFIGDRSNNLNHVDAAAASGIDRLDPNQGGRSVASSRLAKLFGSDVITDVEFATHSTDTNLKGHKHAEKKTRMGVVSKQAAGREGGSYKVARNAAERAEAEQTVDASQVIDVTDPELQRSLNVLQMLDYISLQLDRHAANFYIATDEKGKVVGVTGIDLDVSFGQQGKAGKVTEGGHFVGVPKLADAAFRDKVLSVAPADVRACLDGLVSPAEVDAAVERFEHLCKVLREMAPDKVVQVGGWGKDTAAQRHQDTDYLGKLEATMVEHEFNTKMFPLLKPLEAMTFEHGVVRKAVSRLVDSAALSPSQGVGLVEAIVTSIVTDPTLAEKREMRAGLGKDERTSEKALTMLIAAKAAVEEKPDADAESRIARIEGQMLAAQVEKQAASLLKSTADTEYAAAIDLLIQNLCDFAVGFASRQGRALAPVRRPARR
jgi:hypothetical protein